MSPWFWIVPLAVGVGLLVWAWFWAARSSYGSGADIMAGFGVACVVLALIVGIVAGVLWYNRVECRNSAANLGTPYRWSVTAGCFVLVDGKWVPIDAVREFLDGTP